jgi:hypothetical protein
VCVRVKCGENEKNIIITIINGVVTIHFTCVPAKRRARVQLNKSHRQNKFDYHVSSLNFNHEGYSGAVKVTAAQVAAMATAATAVHTSSTLDGPSLQDKIKALEGVHVPKRMMYRVRETLLEDTALNNAERCKHVHSLLTLFQQENLNVHTYTEYSADNEFRRAFLSHPDVHILGETSQAILGLDGAFLKHKSARTTNFEESGNTKTLHTRGRNPTLYFQYFMEQWMQTKFKRFEQAGNSRYHDISLSNVDIGFVRDMRGSPPTRRRVYLRESKCTCSFSYQYGIPCSRICSILAFINQPERVFDFFDRCYLVETYTLAYDRAASNIELVLDDEIQATDEVQAPQGSRKRGRSKKK